ncbi:MAG: AAA family ATPase [Clostridia bacterium]|nr:AAA family ATPase [Clostridia bacterium]
MDISKLKTELDTLKEELETLPKGYISKKNINNKIQYYLQWSENGGKKSKYIDESVVDILREQIERRKVIKKKIKGIEVILPQGPQKMLFTKVYQTNIKIGEELRVFAKTGFNFKKRSCFKNITDYLYGDIFDKVFILYGLRHTGKITLIRQVIGEMKENDFYKTAFIHISSGDTLADVNADMKRLQASGYKYVFIDEVTLLKDFIDGAALFSDIFASCGMKIVLSGTDSLGFLFSEDEQLYDRCILLHTTFIPYREFENVLGIKGIDEYIRYGGTMSLGGVQYNENSSFATKEKTNDYVDSAIAKNIQHSLQNYQQAGHFRALRDLYDRNELTSAINRIIEDYNHEFTIEVLTRDFVSHDLGTFANNLRHDRNNPTDILDMIDKETFIKQLKELLEIKNKSEQTIMITESHRAQIKEYLDLLDLTMDIEEQSIPVSKIKKRTVFTQPGMRYSQAEAFVKSLMADETFSTLSLEERKRVIERVLSEIKGRMLEEIILLETKLANKKKSVFQLQFAIGKFDMVVADEESATCKVYEIKHSTIRTPEQCKHLMDVKKCADTEFRYGKIIQKVVLYRGETCKVGSIDYVNVEEYLLKL